MKIGCFNSRLQISIKSQRGKKKKKQNGSSFNRICYHSTSRIILDINPGLNTKTPRRPLNFGVMTMRG